MALEQLHSCVFSKGVTRELKAAISHRYTKIDAHPHDPHYLTFSVSAFQLAEHLESENVELIMAHTVEFAVDRINRYGLIYSTG